MTQTSRPFDREGLEAAFEALGAAARRDGKIVEIAVYGGAAMVFTFGARPSTKDVDAVFDDNREWVRGVAARIADENGWDTAWINDGVKGFLSEADGVSTSMRLLRGYPDEREPGVRVLVAQPEYLFAMKAIAMRVGGYGGADDIGDLKLLARALGIGSVGDALTLVERYYPAARVPPRTRFGLEELFDA